MEEEKVVSTEEVAQETEEPKEATEEPKEEPQEEVVAPKKKSAQERIDELTRKRRDAERDAEYWKKKALEKEEPKETTAPAQPPRPRLEQFNTTEEYEDALFAWRDTVRETQEQAKKREREEDEAFNTFNERAEAMRREYEDFDEVITKPVFSKEMKNALLLSESGPQVAYYLGTNPKEAARIRSLSPYLQGVELGRLETKVLLAKQTKKVTSAPAPPTPVGIAGGGKERDPSEMSTEEWMAWDRQRTLEKLKKKLGG